MTKKITKLNQLPEPIKSKAAIALESNERKLHSPSEIATWMGLSRGEREVLQAIRKSMKERTTLTKGSKGWRAATYDQLAKDSGYSTRQVGRLVKSLEKKQVLEIKRPKHGKNYRGSRWGFAIHKQGCCFQAKGS